MLKKMLYSCVALVGLTGYANSADLLPVPVPLYVPSWTGCYVGGHAGYGVAMTTSYYAYPNSSTIAGDGFFTTGEYIHDFNNKGFAGGGQIGCQLQRGMFLWGGEGRLDVVEQHVERRVLELLQRPRGKFQPDDATVADGFGAVERSRAVRDDPL
jgi:opacity protein-like surface antigen